MNIVKWFFMSNWARLMYAMPIIHRNKQSLNLENGYTLNFETMTIEVNTQDTKSTQFLP